MNLKPNNHNRPKSGISIEKPKSYLFANLIILLIEYHFTQCKTMKFVHIQYFQGINSCLDSLSDTRFLILHEGTCKIM